MKQIEPPSIMANHAKCGVPAGDILIEGGRLGVLLAHRLGGTSEDLSPFGATLSSAGYTISVPQLYGHGGTHALLSATTWQHWYASFVEAYEELKSRCDIIVAGGLSEGALLALHLAAEKPDHVHGLLLLSPTFWPDGWGVPWYGRLLRRLTSKTIANLFRLDERAPFGIKDEGLRQAALERMHSDGRASEDVLGRSGGALLELKWLAERVTEEVDRIAQPALIFHSRESDRSRLDVTRLLQTKMRGPTDLLLLDDSYHLVTHDRQRDLVAERSVIFLDQLVRRIDERKANAKLREGQDMLDDRE